MREMRIVVGVDGSPCSSAAVDWAADEAVRRGARLDLVHVAPPDWVALTAGAAAVPPSTDRTPTYVEAEAARVHDLHPDLHVTMATLLGAPASVLIAESDDAALVVVGARGRARVVELVVGSVSRHLAAHSRCPVVVVHEGAVRPDAPVGVGIDDSATARDALRSAALEAQWRGVPLVVVHAWQDQVYAAYGAWVPPVGTPEELALAADRETRAAVAELATQFPDLEVVVRTPMTHPVVAMRDLAREVQLLVVGTHGRGMFPGMLLGSVTSAAIHDARCPVLVTPPTKVPTPA
ncbi:MAG: universal stress protein [Candidatus Nanopelagicales bacterium]